MLPDNNSSGLRHRKHTVREVVEELDAFTKVRDEVKQEKQTFGGFVTVISLIIIILVIFTEIRNYLRGNDEYIYKFTVDATYDEFTELEMDMIVATPCSNLMSQITGGQLNEFSALHRLKKSPTRFEFTDKERVYWNELKKVHDNVNESNQMFRSIQQMTFISGGVEKGLKDEADAKQREYLTLKQKEKQSTKDDANSGAALIIIGDGFNVFHVMSNNFNDNDDSACRIHGLVSVSRVKSTSLVLTAAQGFEFGGLLAHIGGMSQPGNLSHRIGHLSFGPKIRGLVTPLAGTDQITTGGLDEYHYFLKVIPTRIYRAGIFGGSNLIYQYSVTFMKKVQKNDTHKHSSIVINCEFAPVVIEAKPVQISFVQLLVRICSAVGGVFATSAILNGLCAHLTSLWVKFSTSSDDTQRKSSANGDFDGKNTVVIVA